MELMLGHNTPYVLHRGLYPDHERQLTLEWLRGRRWLALTSGMHREQLHRMRESSPGTREFDAARSFDEAFADWLQHGTPANMEEHHGRAASQLELALDGATFHL